MRSYEVLENVRYGGKLHRPAPAGRPAAKVDMDDDAAKAPLDLGAIRPAGSAVEINAAVEMEDPATITIGGDAAVKMVTGLIGTLSPEDFGEDGVPSLDVVNARASADMRGTVVISRAIFELALAESMIEQQVASGGSEVASEETGGSEGEAGGDGGAEDPVVAAIRALDPSEFGSDGVPNLAPLRKAVGRKISSAERDAAWQAYQKAIGGKDAE